MTLAVASVPTVGEALAAATATLAAAGVPEARADAEVLLAHALGTDRAGLVVRARQSLSTSDGDRLDGLVARRARREPVAYVLGEREFWSLPIRVDRRVLIPRPETETLVATALRVAPNARRILDVGTGSGAIAFALARDLPSATVVATDRQAAALEVAAINRARLAPATALVRADLVGAFRDAAFDLVVANPPYCAEGSVVQAEVRDWEPSSALYGGADGLDVLDALVETVPRVLVGGGWLVVEIGIGQAASVAARAEAAGDWTRVEVVRDLAGIERVVAMERR